MWRCPKCETQNEGNFCVVCGEEKSVATNMQNNQMHTQQAATGYEEAKTVIETVPVKKKNNTLVILCVVLAVLLAVCLAFMAGLLLADKSDEAGIPQEMSEPESAEESENAPVEDNAPQEDNVTGKNGGATEYDGYGLYTNTKYDFYCAYPRQFREVRAKGANALACFESPDGTAVMTIRAAICPAGFDIDDALNDFYSTYDGEISYEASGNTWYAISVENNGRSHYRKFFMENGNMYCMDFEFDEWDLDIYSPHIEYIEDNFKTED